MYSQIGTCVILLGSHALALLPGVKALRSGRFPSVVDCAVVSLFIYYDLGIVLELCGVTSEAGYFPQFFSAAPKESVWLTLVLACAPWVLKMGELVVNPKRLCAATPVRLRKGSAGYFGIVSVALVLVSLSLGVLGTSYESIWLARSNIGSTLGDAIIVLYVPLFLLVFFLHFNESSSWWGQCYAILMTAAASAATLVIGQRTLVLLPPVIFAALRMRRSLKRVVLVGTLALVGAAALLPVFKWQFSGPQGLGPLITSTLANDLYRAPVLLETWRKSAVFGTDIMPYSGAGYVYSALFFVPRRLVPMKGHSSAQWFTAAVTNDKVDETNWGFGMSAINELMLNFGTFMVVPGIALYGVGLALLDRLSAAVPTTTIPSRLFAIWIMGYHLPALLLLFGTMIITCVLLHTLFADRMSNVAAVTVVVYK
jgi:hypothetical protein